MFSICSRQPRLGQIKYLAQLLWLHLQITNDDWR
jgi:hypothetical protein